MVLLLFCFDFFDNPIHVVLELVYFSHHSLFKQSADLQFEILTAQPLSLSWLSAVLIIFIEFPVRVPVIPGIRPFIFQHHHHEFHYFK